MPRKKSGSDHLAGSVLPLLQFRVSQQGLMVPKVNLLDAQTEPSDAELEALMLDFQRVVAMRGDAAQAAYFQSLADSIDEAMLDDPQSVSPPASSSFGYGS